LPFRFQAHGDVGRLTLEGLSLGPLVVDRLELDVTDLATVPGINVAERFQRRRTRLRTLVLDRRPATAKHQAHMSYT